MSDLTGFMASLQREFANMVRETVREELAPLVQRIAALEAKPSGVDSEALLAYVDTQEWFWLKMDMFCTRGVEEKVNNLLENKSYVGEAYLERMLDRRLADFPPPYDIVTKDDMPDYDDFVTNDELPDIEETVRETLKKTLSGLAEQLI